MSETAHLSCTPEAKAARERRYRQGRFTFTPVAEPISGSGRTGRSGMLDRRPAVPPAASGISATEDTADTSEGSSQEQQTVAMCDVWSCERQPTRLLYHPVAEAHRETCLACAEEMTMFGGWIDVTDDRRLRLGGTAIAVRRSD